MSNVSWVSQLSDEILYPSFEWKFRKDKFHFFQKKLLKKRTHRLGLRWKLGLLHLTWGFRNFCESARFFFLFYSLGWLLARQEAAYRRLDPTKAALVCSHWMKEHKILSGFKEPASKILVKVHGRSLFLSWLVVGPIRGDLQKMESNKSSFGLFTLNEGQTFLRPDQKSLCQPVCKALCSFWIFLVCPWLFFYFSHLSNTL